MRAGHVRLQDPLAFNSLSLILGVLAVRAIDSLTIASLTALQQMGSTADGSAPRTGSINGRYTFHLPNGWSRRYLEEQAAEDAVASGGDDGEGDEEDANDGNNKAARNGVYTAVSQNEDGDESAAILETAGDGPIDRYNWESDGTVPQGKRAAILLAFCVLGAAVLLPFNSLITPSEYYRYLLAGSPRANGFMSWILVSFNVATIIVGAHATVSMHKTSPARRIYLSSASIFVSLLLLTFFTMWPMEAARGQAGNWVFVALLAFSLFIASATAYLQNAVVALCSIFGGRSMGLMLSGQGLVGLLISVVQLVAANTKTSTASVAEDLDQVSRAATVFFAFSTAFMAFAIATFIWLARLRVYQKTCRGFDVIRSQGVPSDQSGGNFHTADAATSTFGTALVRWLPAASRPRARLIWQVQAKLRGLSFAITYIFTVTLATFPALTSRVVSTDTSTVGWKRPFVFVAWHYVCFNGFDLVGRLLPALSPIFVIRSTTALVIGSLARTLAIPLLLACNVRPNVAPGSEASSPNASSAPFSDGIFFALVALFAVTNGLISTGVMVSGPASEKLTNDNDRATAGAILTFWLAVGLATGSFLSFAVGAAV